MALSYSGARGGVVGGFWALALVVSCGGNEVPASSDAAPAAGGNVGAVAGDASTSQGGVGGESPIVDGSGGAGGAPGADGFSKDAAVCNPVFSDQWSPLFTPPRPPILGACTTQQIGDLYASCDVDSPTYSLASCHTYEVDPANAACVGCMFTVEGDPAFGPIVTLRDRSRFANLGGCIALVDGDSSATGCGAKYWARVECDVAACKSCAGASFSACVTASHHGGCSGYYEATVCAEKPLYARCVGLGPYKAYFLELGAIFCSTGLSDGGLREAGTTDSGPG